MRGKKKLEILEAYLSFIFTADFLLYFSLGVTWLFLSEQQNESKVIFDDFRLF